MLKPKIHRCARYPRTQFQCPPPSARSHAQFYGDDTSPEAKDAFEEIAGFFDKHLGK